MTEKQLEALREWVRSEIAYEFAVNEEDEGGYRSSAINERDYAENCFGIVKKLIGV